jgi:hypothetical protein
LWGVWVAVSALLVGVAGVWEMEKVRWEKGVMLPKLMRGSVGDSGAVHGILLMSILKGIWF